MKRFYLFLAACLVCTGAFAQEDGPSWKSKVVHPTFDVRVSIGGPNALYSYPENVFEGADSYYYMKSNIKLADIYEPYYELNASPTFTAEFNYHPGQRFYVGADLSWNRAVGRKYDPVTDNKIAYKKFNSGYLMGKGAIYWVQFPHIKIYSALYAGLEFRHTNDNAEHSNAVKPAVDLSIFGAEWAGDVVFGFTEVIVGSRMNFIKLGVGYRF